MIFTIFALLVVYQLKHFVADYPLQGRYMLGKFKPGWEFVLPLLAHVGVHAAGTLGIALAFGVSAPRALLLALFDAGVHFTMDRIKASPRLMGRWKPLTADQYVSSQKTLSGPPMSDDEFIQALWISEAKRKLLGNKLFWWALGFDQLVHHLTHYACIAMILASR